jgi:2-iminobutanoate/2-iminopropanoate deaminase
MRASSFFAIIDFLRAKCYALSELILLPNKNSRKICEIVFCLARQTTKAGWFAPSRRITPQGGKQAAKIDCFLLERSMRCKVIQKTEIRCANAPAAIGPYSQAIAAAPFLFVSGQLPVDPQSGEMPMAADAQAEQCLRNLCAVLAEAGLSAAAVCKTTVFLTDMDDFAAVNAVYARYFTPPFPARACVAVRALPKGAKVEIECVAALA